MSIAIEEPQHRKRFLRRPGPFGPARALLPPEQKLLLLKSSALVGEAIERMVDEGFSQIPVTDRSGKIIGVFSWRSFSKRIKDLGTTSIKPMDLPLKEATESANFIDPDVYIDTSTDWGDVDHVIVGTDTEPLGILCVADVFGRLNDFAEAFVLLYEIEHEIRDMTTEIFTPEELQEVLEYLVVSASRPTAEALEALKEYVEEHGNSKATGKAIKVLKSGGMRPIGSLEDLSFSQYTSIVCSEKNWPKFEPIFDTMREIIENDFKEVNQLRNTVFHFRRGITPKDTDRLRRFRDRIRYDRELYSQEVSDLEKD